MCLGMVVVGVVERGGVVFFYEGPEGMWWWVEWEGSEWWWEEEGPWRGEGGGDGSWSCGVL